MVVNIPTVAYSFFSLFYPRVCWACYQALLPAEECICTVCHYQLPQTNFHTQEDNPVSHIFWGRLPLVSATSLLYFQKHSKVQNLIHQFKYRGKKEIGLYLGNVLGRKLNESANFNNIDLIIPVPLHASKEHQRGFNQSEIISRGISESMKIDVEVKNLVKINRTDTQTKKSRFRRWQNVETVFHVHKPEKLAGRNILLVDDVITTGSTLEACGHNLLKIDGVKLWIASLALAR